MSSSTHSILESFPGHTQLSEYPPKYRGVCRKKRDFPLNYSSVKFPLKVIFKGEV